MTYSIQVVDASGTHYWQKNGGWRGDDIAKFPQKIMAQKQIERILETEDLMPEAEISVVDTPVS